MVPPNKQAKLQALKDIRAELKKEGEKKFIKTSLKELQIFNLTI